MARRALGPAALQVVQAVRSSLAGHGRPASPAGPDTHLVVGCSGGADSTALALACQVVLGGGTGWLVRVVDHGLQPGSAAHTARVVERLVARGLPVEAVAVEVAKTTQGLEAAARDARYRALRAPVPGCAGTPLVLVGHTLDDQAESVVLGLARGSGPASLSGMAQHAHGIVRPLLGVRRATTEQACREWGIEVWHDPHNDSCDFTRVRVRRQVLPIMGEALGPGVPEALARTAELLRADHELLDGWAERELALASNVPAAEAATLDCAHLAGLPTALRTRVLRRWVQQAGLAGPSHERTQAIEALVVAWHGQGPIDLAGGGLVRRIADRLVIETR